MNYNEYLTDGNTGLNFNLVPRALHVYWLCKDITNKIIRVGITKNPYLIAAKAPDNTHIILFQVKDKEQAETLANAMISDLKPDGQGLFNVYTIGKAARLLRKVCSNYNLENIVQSYNEASGTNQKIYSHNGKKWISKNVVDDYISMIEYLNNRGNERK